MLGRPTFFQTPQAYLQTMRHSTVDLINKIGRCMIAPAFKEAFRGARVAVEITRSWGRARSVQPKVSGTGPLVKFGLSIQGRCSRRACATNGEPRNALLVHRGGGPVHFRPRGVLMISPYEPRKAIALDQD
jgi:hypothetical protein